MGWRMAGWAAAYIFRPALLVGGGVLEGVCFLPFVNFNYHCIAWGGDYGNY